MGTRKNIFEILESNFNIESEFTKIDNMFIANDDFYKKINYDFHRWKGRGSALSCQDMRNQINKILSTKVDTTYILNLLEYHVNMFLLYVKYYLDVRANSFNSFIRYIKEDNDPKLYAIMINVQDLIERLQHTVIFIKEKDQAILVSKDPTAIAAAELSSNNTALAIMQYHHRLLKGDIEAKKSLLIKIAHEYEPMLDKEAINKDNLFKDYFMRTKALLNNLDIRHNNSDEDSNKFKEELKNMNKNEIENWYDDTYQLLLFCKLIVDNSDRKFRADELCKVLKNS